MFNKMVASGLSPEVRSYTALLEAYGRVGDYVKAEEVVLSMQANGFVPDKVTLALLVRIFGRSGVFELGLHYFEMIATDDNMAHDLCRQVVESFGEKYIDLKACLPPKMTDFVWREVLHYKKSLLTSPVT